jgi:hypothetical protein
MNQQSQLALQTDNNAPEQPVDLIPLALDITNAEVSGLAWHGDNLIILPQYPNWEGTPGDGCVQVIRKSDILAFLDGKSAEPLNPREVPFYSSGMERRIEGFQGYEALAVHGNHVYMTIEAETDHMMGYIVVSHFAPDMSELRLDPDRVVAVTPQATIPNASYETLLIAGDRLVTVYEGNGVNVNPHPIAYEFDFSFNPLGSIPFPHIEYRITDASTPDEQGFFWAMNVYWPGSKDEYKPAPDPLAARYGKGTTHTQTEAVERLIKFRYTSQGITLADEAPIQLRLLDPDHVRNWEGLVTLDDRGFLIITDRFPEAMLGFVSL